ncbi:MAG: prepilin peptidase [bacterium]|nr:prepilin peptidase [bacterium]
MWLTFILVSGFLFFIGAAVGSFLNVFIYRTLDDEPRSKKDSWISGRSRCDTCRKKIAWYDNIPVLTFLLLGGKCRHCHSPISLAHPVVEFLTGSLFVWWYWGGTVFFQITRTPLQTLQPIFWLAIGILLLIIVIADILYLVIPDAIVAMLLGLTLLYRIALVMFGVMRPTDFGLSIVGVAVAVSFFGLLWLGTKGRGFGLGDVKLIVPLALLVGWPEILVCIFLAFIAGATVGVSLIALGKRKFGQVIPFGPFLVAGCVMTLIWGTELLQWYIDLLR